MIRSMFQAIFQSFCNREVCKVEFSNTSGARKIARKITKILRSFGFQLKFESCKSVMYSWCCEF